PAVVFAPHVETASGMLLPDDHLRGVADAVHAAGGLFVLDCVASGALWVDMQAMGVDVLISAPQKGWSASPCCALVMLGEAARPRTSAPFASAFSAWTSYPTWSAACRTCHARWSASREFGLSGRG